MMQKHADVMQTARHPVSILARYTDTAWGGADLPPRSSENFVFSAWVEIGGLSLPVRHTIVSVTRIGWGSLQQESGRAISQTRPE